MSHTHINLGDVHDSAPDYGFGHRGEARFAREALGAVATGIAYHRLRPDTAQGFAHRHDNAEEVAIVLSGSGTVTIDAQVVALAPLDAVRIAPSAVRRFAAGPQGLDFLVVGPHHPGDGEIVPAD